MKTVISRDGTTIAHDVVGEGPPLILVDGALCHRTFGPAAKLAAALAPQFTVFTYDRRGGGESGDTPPYAVEREIDDIEALLACAGGSAFVFGVSSGAVLALEAANRLPGIRALALYEAPFVVDNTHPARPDDFVATMMKTVGVPVVVIAVMRVTPVWKKLKAVAHTLPYDFRMFGDTGSGKPLPATRWAGVQVPALAIAGAKSPVWLRNAMRALADLLPECEYRVLDGQTHIVKAAATAPVLVEFFAGQLARRG